MLAVVPQQTVGHGAQQQLRPPCNLLGRERAALHRPVHVVQQDPGSVGEVLHGVHPDAGPLREHPEEETGVGDHLLDQPPVRRQHRQDVGYQVRHPVIPEVDAEVGKKGPGHLQKVSPLEPVRRGGRFLSL